jgi:hypothetical protein
MLSKRHTAICHHVVNLLSCVVYVNSRIDILLSNYIFWKHGNIHYQQRKLSSEIISSSILNYSITLTGKFQFDNLYHSWHTILQVFQVKINKIHKNFSIYCCWAWLTSQVGSVRNFRISEWLLCKFVKEWIIFNNI